MLRLKFLNLKVETAQKAYSENSFIKEEDFQFCFVALQKWLCTSSKMLLGYQ